MTQSIPLLLILCTTCCFLCQPAKALQINCTIQDNTICGQSFCQDADVDLATTLCPHVCGYCDKVTSANCSKGDRQGVCEGNFCSTNDADLQKALCPNLCGHCTSATAVSATSAAPPCRSVATNGLRCQDIPNVCSSAYSRVVCPELCTNCSGGGSAGATGTAPPPGACVDYVGNGYMCSQLPGLCNDPTSVGPKHFCPKFCNICGTTSEAPTSTTQASITTVTTATTTTVAPCVDIGLFGMTCSDLNSTLDVCNDPYGQKSCPDFCGQCPCVGPSRNASADCVDQAEPGVCAQPGFCEDQFAIVVCKQTCFPERCENAGCRDHLSLTGATCADQHGTGQPWPTLEDLCKDPLGAKICQATCGCVGFCPEKP